MEESTGVLERQLVVFDLNQELYGVDIGTVRQIIRMQDITHVPRAPGYVEGVINLRGRVIRVVELRRRFGIQLGECTNDNRIVVVDIGGQDIGMIVDAVTEVLRVPGDTVEPPSTVVTGEDSDYLLGIVRLEERLIILLDIARVLADAEGADALESAAVAA